MISLSCKYFLKTWQCPSRNQESLFQIFLIHCKNFLIALETMSVHCREWSTCPNFTSGYRLHEKKTGDKRNIRQFLPEHKYLLNPYSHFCGLIVLHKKLLNSWFVHSFFSSIKALYLHSICSIFASYHTSSSRVLPTTNAPSKDTFAFCWITCRKLDL